MDDKVKEEFARLQEAYANDTRQQSFNLLLLGESGTGKTFIARTARKPVHIDSFDPGGTKGLRKQIAAGEVIVDTRYEGEDPMAPSVYGEWKKNFLARVRMGYFNHIGTYMLDSSTTWSEAIMNQILKEAKIPGEAPRFTKDYTPQKIEIRNRVRQMLDLPCDFILTGHLKIIEDQVTGQPTYRFLTTGQGAVIIPLLFDELWVMDPRKSPEGVAYRVLTKSTGTHVARSRLASDGLLAQYEDPDLKAMLKKVGLPANDKPLLK